MADIKKFLSLERLKEYDALIKAKIDNDIATHEHSWDDLNDKPFYNNQAFEPIYWDGNTDGLESIDIDDGAGSKFYKLSDQAITNVAEITTTTVYSNGESVVEDMVVTEHAVESGIYAPMCRGNLTVVSIPTQEAVEAAQSGMFPGISIGTWAVYMPLEMDDGKRLLYVSKITPVSETKQLDEQFIPDTIARTEYVEETFATKDELANIDLTPYETVENAQAKLEESKAYTDEQIGLHEHSWNELNDKPFGETVSASNTLIWDGNTEGLESAVRDDGYVTYYKVTDGVLTDEEIKTCALIIPGRSPLVIADNWDMLLDAGVITEDCVSVEAFVIVKRDNAICDDTQFKTAGIYALGQTGDTSIVGTSLVSTEPIFTTVATKTIDEQFIPETIARTSYVDENFALKTDLENIDLTPYETKEDAQAKLDEAKSYTDEQIASHKHSWDELEDKPFGEEVTEVEVLPETTVTFNDKDHIDIVTNAIIMPGNSYTVTWNGVKYDCVAAEQDGMTYIGNVYSVSGGASGTENTSEPFAILDLWNYYGVMGIMLYRLDGTTEPTVSIKGINVDIKQIDEMYLPEHLQFVDEKIPLITNTTIVSEDNDRPYLRTDKSLNIGDTYIVTWNGVDYTCVAKAYMGNPYIGDASSFGVGESTGEPFAIQDYTDSNYSPGYYFYILDGSTEVVFSISKLNRVINEKYIPSTIARTETVDALAANVGEVPEGSTVMGIITEIQENAYDDTELSGKVDEVTAKVTTLVGDDADKSVRTIANEELAKQLVPENAKEALNTLEEIAAWIQAHPDDVTAINVAIQALQAKTALGTYVDGEESKEYATVKAYVEAVLEAEAKRTDDADTALSGRLDALEAIDHDAYIAADTALKDELNGEIAKKADASVVEAMDTAYKAADTAITGRLDALEAHEHSWNELTDKPFYEVVEEVEVLPETTIVTPNGEPQILRSMADVTLGDSCTVTWDGVEYTCTVVEFNGVLGVGDLYTLTNGQYGTESTGEPFVIAFPSSSVLQCASFDTNEHTVAIRVNAPVIKQLDEKYLPDYLQFETSQMTIISNVSMKATSSGVVFRTNKPLEAGETYIVTWNDVEYICVAKSIGEFPYLGDISSQGVGESTGEPFAIVDATTANYNIGYRIMSLDGTTEQTLSIKQVVRRIDDKCVPKDILYVHISTPSESGTGDYQIHPGRGAGLDEVVEAIESRSKWIVCEMDGDTYWQIGNPRFSDEATNKYIELACISAGAIQLAWFHYTDDYAGKFFFKEEYKIYKIADMDSRVTALETWNESFEEVSEEEINALFA